MTTAQHTAPLPGQYFDVPGYPGGSSQFTEQDDTTSDAVVNLSQSNSVPVTNINSFRQTDVVMDWLLAVNVAQTYTQGTGQTLTASAYAPMNVFGPVKNVIQNQYASLDVESGIDWYIFSLIRPYQLGGAGLRSNVGSNPAGSPLGGSAQGYQAAALAQANNINSGQWTSGQAAYSLMLRIPAGQFFDRYYELAVTGENLSLPHPACVSPQYMAGTTRVITPAISLNPMYATTTDNAPVVTTTLTATGDTPSTATGTATFRTRRRAVYAGDPATLPPAHPWQYRQKTQRFGLAGVSKQDINVPNDTGQVLALYVRLFDPAANGGLGAPININTVTRFSLLYGAGLQRVDWQTGGGINAAAFMQERWFAQHGDLLPPGVFAVDLATDERGLITNARALNTLTTSGIVVHLEFTGTQSASAYAVLGLESLVYVA